MNQNNINQVDLTSISGISNINKLNLTGISTFTQNSNLNNIQNNQNGVDLKSLDINKNYSLCESTLEFFIISLSKNLNINSKQSVALLSNNKKYLLRLFYKGIKNDFTLPIQWLNDINSNLQILQNLMINSTDQKNVSMSFGTLSVGLYSSNIDCVRITNTILTKLSIEIGADWDWFSSEGYICYIFSIDKYSIIKNKLVNGLCTHIKGHEEDFIKLLKDKFNNEEEENEDAYKEIGNFILNILPILNNGVEDREKKIQKGIINLIIELIELNYDKKIDGPLFISLITQAWLNNPEVFTNNKNIKNISLNYLKENIRIYNNLNSKFDTININSISSIANLFYLLNDLGKIKNEDGPLIYRTLVFLFIEEYDEELKREFMLDNFSHFFLMNLKFPIDIFITPYFKQIKRVKNISMADFNFLAIIIGHPRFTCEHALDLLDFILDITLNNLIFSKTANMLLNLIFSMKLLIKNKSVFEKAETKFIEYIIQILNLYISNIKSNIKDNSILEVPYDIILEGFGKVNQEIEATLINIIEQYRSIKGENSGPLLGLLWFFKSHDDVLLRLEEKFSTEPKKAPLGRSGIDNINIKAEKNNNNNKADKNNLKPINKNKLNSTKIKEKENNDDINNILKQSVELVVKKMKGEKEEKMKIKKEKVLEQKRLKESRMKKQLEKELAMKNAAFNNNKKKRPDAFFDEANFSQTNLIQEEGSVISQSHNGFIRRPLSKAKLNSLMNLNNNKYIFLVGINEEETREEKGIEALNIKYKPKIKNLVRILTDDSGNITKASILRYFRDKKLTNSDLTLDELSLCVRNTFSANINLFDEVQFKKLLVTISYVVMNKRRNNYTLCEAYYNFLKIIIDDLDTNFNWKYKKYINILEHLKNNLDEKTGEIGLLLPPGFKIVQKTDIFYKSKIPKPMLKNFTESYAICLSLINEFISNALNNGGILEKFLKVKKIYDIEIELSMVRPWTENLMIAYSLLPKDLEKYGIEAANALDDGLKNLFRGKDRKGEAKMGNYEKEKIKNENKIRIIEQKKEDMRKKRGKEIKTKVEQYKKEKEEKEKKNREIEEKKKEEEQIAFHNMIKESKRLNKKKKEEINKMKQKKQEENQEKIQELKNKEKEDEKIHKEEQKKFFVEQNKKMKEQFKQIKQQKEDFLKKKQELLPENQKIPKILKNYFKEEQNFIEFDRNLIPKLKTLMNSTNNISNYIKIYDQHLRLIFGIYHKIGQNKITSISGNNDDSLYLNEYKEFLTNFGLLNILLTKEQMNFIYKRLTRKNESKDNKDNKENNDKDYEQKQYLTYNDFRTSFLLLTIMAHLNSKEIKITEEDYNILDISKIEELFEYLGLKIPYARKDIEKLINDRRGMSAKDFFGWQQKMKKDYYDKFKGIQRKENERKNSIIPHCSNRPKSSIKLNKKIISQNINVNLKRVASKEDIDRKNMSRKKVNKNDVNTINTQNNNIKIINKKLNIKSISNKEKDNGNKNNSLEKNMNKNINVNNNKEKIGKNKNKSTEKIIKVEKKETNKIQKIKKTLSKEIKVNKTEEAKVKNNINENKRSDNKINNNQLLNNSDVSIVYTSITKNENEPSKNPKEVLINNNENNEIENNGIENNEYENNENEINDDEKNNNEDNNDNENDYFEYSKNIIKNNKENIKDDNEKNYKKKSIGFNMKIKTADGKEENWNIQE